MKGNNQYDLSNIINEDHICTLEELNNGIKRIEETEASKMFSYITNNIGKDTENYEKIFYMTSDCTCMGIFAFEDVKIKKILPAFKEINIGVQAYIKFREYNIEYIISQPKSGEKKDFIIVQSGTPASLYYNGKCFIFKKVYKNKLVIYNNKSIYCENSKKFFPANLKSLSKINIEVGKIILKYYSSMHVFWKDILKDYTDNLCFCPIPLLLVWEAHSKKELLEQKNKITLTNSINKYSMKSAYLLAASLKYIEPNEFQKLEILTDKEISEFDSVNDLFIGFYRKTLPFSNKHEDFDIDIEDYCWIVIAMKEKFNLKMKGFKKLADEHNRLAIKYTTKFVKKIKISTDNPFSKLKLPDKYIPIRTKKALIQESVINNNCVATYDSKISKGKCAIYTTTYNQKRYTIEIRRKKSKGEYLFYVKQLYGKSNSIAPKELYKELNELMEKENYRLISCKND